jgi:hypothetical protein
MYDASNQIFRTLNLSLFVVECFVSENRGNFFSVSDKAEDFVSARSTAWKVGYCPRLSVDVEGCFPFFDKVEGYVPTFDKVEGFDI